MYYSKNLKQDYIINKMSKFVSSKYGDIHRFNIVSDENKNFNVITGFRPKNINSELGGTGASRDFKKAIICAMGETLERNAFFNVKFDKTNTVLNKTYLDLKSEGFNALNPQKLKPYSEKQYNNENFDCIRFYDNTNIDWMLCENISKNIAELVPMSYIAAKCPSNKVLHTNSSGLACGDSKIEAILKGIYEIIERDAVCFAWWSKSQFPLIDMSTLENIKIDGTDINNFLAYHKDNVKLINLTTDIGIPVIGSIYMSSNSEQPAFLISAACNIDPIKAIEKSIVELMHCYYGSMARLDREYKKVSNDFDKEILDFPDHINYYIRHENKDKVQFLCNSDKKVSVDEINNYNQNDHYKNLTFIIERLNALNFDIYTFSYTSDTYLKNNLYVYKTFIPGLIMLEGPHKYRCWGEKRLFTLKKKLGMCDIELTVDDLNIYPHPFP